MPDNKIQVDLELAVKKLGYEGISDALKKQPGLVRAIAEGMGGTMEDAVATSVSKGVERGMARALQNKVSRVEGLFGSKLNLKDFIEKTLGPRPSSSKGQSYYESVFGGGLSNIAVPPIIQKGGIMGFLANIEKQLSGNKGVVGSFMKYEVGNAFAHSIGLGGGVGGRLGGAAFSGLASKAPGVTVALAGLTLAIDLAKIAIRQLAEAAQQGYKTYIQSRTLGLSTANTASFNALGILGINPGEISSMSRFLPQSGSGGNVAGRMLGAARLSGASIQTMQQILNFSREINDVWARTRDSAVLAGKSAHSNFSSIIEWQTILTKISSLKQGYASMLEPFVYGLSRSFQSLVLDPAVRTMTGLLSLIQKIPGVPKDILPQRIAPFMRENHFSSLEHMGLVIGSSGGSPVLNVLKQIEKNTRGKGGAESMADAKKHEGPPFGSAGMTQFSATINLP